MTPLPGPLTRAWHQLATPPRRQAIARTVLRRALAVARRLDPELADMHVVRKGMVFGVRALLDPCVPPGRAFITQPGMARPLVPPLTDAELGRDDDPPAGPLLGRSLVDHLPFLRRGNLREGGRITFDPPVDQPTALEFVKRFDPDGPPS